MHPTVKTGVPGDPKNVAALSSKIKGSVFQPGDAAYEEACRIWNGMVSHRPALVVQPAGSDDVAQMVTFCRATGLPLSVRGGGHNIAGAALSDGGITIDMSRRRAVEIDPDQMSACVEAGATLRDLDFASQKYGLLIPSGIVSATGVAGLTLGGGFGWTSRKFGFTAENLIGAEIVTADGVVRAASANEDPDLFWAIRGGGGNYGIVTSFTFRAHRHGPTALCGMVVHPAEVGGDLLRFYKEVTARAPDELTCLLMLREAPPLPFIPEAYHFKPIVAIMAHWTGDPAEGTAAMDAIKGFGHPIADTIKTKEFIDFQSSLDAGQPAGRRYYWKSDSAGEISDGLTSALVASARSISSPYSAILVMHMGGSPARMDPNSSAVGISRSGYTVVFQSAWEVPGDDGPNIGWARDSLAAVAPFSSGSTYVNFITADEGETRLRAAYGDKLYTRLREVKKEYDPENLFRGKLNIPPV
jgi:hypothetical protein